MQHSLICMFAAPTSSCTRPSPVYSYTTSFKAFSPCHTLQLSKPRLSRRGNFCCSKAAKQTCQTAPSQQSAPSKDRITCTGLVAGPSEAPPSYTNIDASPWNNAIMALFRRKMVVALAEDTEAQGYDAIIDLTRKLNSKYKHPKQTQEATKKILKSLFPGWLPGAFSAMFSRPVPQLACQLNAWVTTLTCQWLMGPCKINDLELADGTVRPRQGVLVERCRYLEEAGCASICINSCKVPTQEFFQENMGLMLTMTPNYEDYSCQFSFGQAPLSQDQDDVFAIPCFQQCPSKKRHTSQQQCHGIEVERPGLS